MKSALEILLVEDNEGDVEMTLHALQNCTPPCNVTVANDGTEGLDALAQSGKFSDAPAPNLIFLDLNMPKMEGKQFLEIVKADVKWKSIPVIMLTSSQSPSDMQGCYERYASCYIVKPFDNKEFAATLQGAIHFWNGIGRLP